MPPQQPLSSTTVQNELHSDQTTDDAGIVRLFFFALGVWLKRDLNATESKSVAFRFASYHRNCFRLTQYYALHRLSVSCVLYQWRIDYLQHVPFWRSWTISRMNMVLYGLTFLANFLSVIFKSAAHLYIRPISSLLWSFYSITHC